MTARVRLRTAMRIRPRPRLRGVSVGASAFANKLHARYAHQRAHRRALALLLSARASLLVQNVLQRLGVEIKLPSMLLLADRRAETARVAAARGEGRASTRALPVRRWERQAAGHVRSVEAVLRLVHRSVRVEALPATQPANQQMALRPIAGDTPVSAAVAMPVLRAALRTASDRRVPDESTVRARHDVNVAADEPRLSGPIAASAPARGAGVELDIETLAERVIGSIDRRIVAQRERFGRS